VKIANKISLSFLITAVMLTAVAASIFYTIAGNNLEKAIFEHLRTTAQSRANHIETFLEAHKQTVELVASGFIFQELLSASKDTPGYSKKLEVVSSRINTAIKVHKEILGISLFDKNGIVVASTDEASVGSDKSADKTYLKTSEATYIRDMHFSEISGIPAIDIGAPVLLNGESLGVVVADLDVGELFKITLDRTGLGETGEIYLINKDAYMISPSRFKEGVILKQRVDTINARNFLMHKDKKHTPGMIEVAVFPDYRGINVLGTHEYIPMMQWGLLAEIDEKEALAPLGKIKLLVAITLAFVPIMAWLIGVFIAKLISGPIHNLHKGTEIIGKGGLDYKVATDSKDEIGQLSRVFDKMTEDLQKTTTSIDKLNKEINERKRAEEALLNSEARIRAIVNTAVDGIITIDEQGIIQSFNPSAERLFGYAAEETIGQNVEILMPSPYREAHRSYIANYLRTGEEKIIGIGVEAVARRRDGTAFPIDLAVSEVYLGKQRIFTGIIRDITERKDAEEALQKAKEEAEVANKTKSEFLASMSHEIRTPMNAIIGMADLLSETPLTSEQQQYVQVFGSAGENLLNIINDILDISKVEAGHLDLEEIDFDLGEVVEKTGEIMSLRANEKGLDLACHVVPDVPTGLVGDPVRLRQILVNLIGNAIKFTEKGEVVVEVKIAGQELENAELKKDDKDQSEIELLFSVTDTGIGIPPEKKDVIFDTFTQADVSTTRKHGGTGLGLTISKRLVELMGGRIWVESKQGQGSTFYFTASFKVQTEARRRVQPPPAVTRPAPLEDLRPLRILFVEDSPDNRLLIQSYLKKTPYQLDIAENGQIAVERFISGKYDLVLMDMQMPVMDGYTATREIRKWENQKGVKATPVIALTAYATKEEEQKSLDAGCNAHLVKPIKKANLMEAILEYASEVGVNGVVE